MAAIQLSGDAGVLMFDPEAISVEVKRQWSDDWKYEPYLTPQEAKLCIAPDMPSASFLYHYGQIKREDQGQYADYDPLNISNWYVRIVIDGQQVFVGMLQDDEFDLLGALNNQPSGDQKMTAYGLEHLLDRIALYGAHTESGYIKHMPAFNLAENYGGIIRGNRSDAEFEGAYLFANSDNRWSNLDIIRYVLKYHTAEMGFTLALSGQFDVLSDVFGVYWFEGLTVRQLLDKLIDRRRGLGWYIWSDGESVSIHIFTVFDRDVGLGNIKIPGNPQLVDIDTDAYDVQSVSIAQSQSQLYDRIIVQGARAQAVCTLSVTDGDLVPNWTAPDENDYKNAPGASAKQRDNERESDNYETVYQQFVLAPEWDQTAVDGAAGFRIPVMPTFDDLAYLKPNTQAVIVAIRRPLNRTLPLSGDVSDGKRPLVLVLATIDGQQKYMQIDGASKPLGSAKSQVRMLDDQPGISLKPAINHALALNHFFTEISETEVEPVVDYESVLATVCFETDIRPTVEINLQPDTDSVRTLVLTAHDAEFWYVTPGTIRGVSDGQLITDPGGAVRDDTEKLRYLAALASGWYSQRRSSITLMVRDMPGSLVLGSIVVSASSSWHKEPIGTVLSSVAFDFINRTTTIMTGYAELDLQTLLDIPGMSDFRSVGRAFNRQQAQIRQLTDRLSNMPVRYAGSNLSTDESEESSVEVDFIVDNFDRGNNVTLGAYWSPGNNNMQIVGGAAVPAKNTTLSANNINKDIIYRSKTSKMATAQTSETPINIYEVRKTVKPSVDGYTQNQYGATYPTYYGMPIRHQRNYKVKIKLKNKLLGSSYDLNSAYGFFAGLYNGYKNAQGSITTDRFAVAISYFDEYKVEVPEASVSFENWGRTDVGPFNLWLASLTGPSEYTLTELVAPLELETGVITASAPAIPEQSVSGGYFHLNIETSVGGRKSYKPSASFPNSSTDFFQENTGVLYHTATYTPPSSGTRSLTTRDTSFELGDTVSSAASWSGVEPYVVKAFPSTALVSAENRVNWNELNNHSLDYVDRTTNELLIDITSDAALFYLNDNLIGQAPLGSSTPQGFIGLSSLLSQIGSSERYEVKQIKAWLSDIPEPPDSQSGHGYFNAGSSQYQYIDGYHSLDSEGALVYDPTALDN